MTDVLDEPLTFAEHKESTAKDCESIIELITSLAAKIREGNMGAFEEFWIVGGTEEGDAKILQLRELVSIRYMARQERLPK